MHAISPRAARAVLLLAVLMLVVVTALPATAQTLNYDIYGPAPGMRFVAMADPMGAEAGRAAPPGAGRLEQIIVENLRFIPFVETLEKAAILGGTNLQGYDVDGIDFRRFEMAGADYLVTARWVQSNEVELRVFGVFSQRLLVGKAYTIDSEEQIPGVADKFCGAFMEAINGPAHFFESSLAFIQNKNVQAMRATGRDRRQLTNLDGSCLSPAWSMDGRYVAFTHIGDRAHALGIWDSSGNVNLHEFRNSTVIGPAFMPDNRVAVSISQNGNSDIYLLDTSFSNRSPLVTGGAIEVSPCFDASGGVMAYVSDRFGGPQVFLTGPGGGEGRRVTYQGSYNTDPSLSPDGKRLVYSRRTPEGYRIFLLDLENGNELQLSWGPGNDEEPAFDLDGYFVAYTSRGRIMLTTIFAEGPIEVPTGGGASFPAWGMP